MKDALIFLKHILESIEIIENNLKNMTKEKFKKDVNVQDATIRRIEIIGEAVKNLSLSFRNKYVYVPWKEIAGTRDKMIHHYFGVDIEFVYDLTKKEIPKLKKEIIKILKELK